MPISLDKCKADMKKYVRKTKDYPKLSVTHVESVPAPGIKSLMFKAVVLGETDNYTSYIQFFKVDYNEKQDKDFTVPALVASSTVFHKKPSLKANPVFLYCSCEDFRFRWMKPLYDNKGLLGNWKRYSRVTAPPPKGHTYLNPQADGLKPQNADSYTGYCKHIFNLLGNLKNSSQVVD